MLIWLDNQIYDAHAARASPLSASNLSGWGVFSTLAIRNSQPLWLARHIARLHRDGAQMNLVCPFDDATIGRACDEIIAANQIENGIARLTLCGMGDGRWNPNTGASLLISAIESKVVSEDICLWLAPQRISANRPLCGVKCTSYAPWQWLWEQAQKRGCDEAIYCNSNGDLCEGARSNLFWVKNGEIYTPALDCGALPGIGRALLMEIARNANLVVKEGAWAIENLAQAEEIFLTNAVTGPRCVVSIINEESGFFRARQTKIVAQLRNLWRLAVTRESEQRAKQQAIKQETK